MKVIQKCIILSQGPVPTPEHTRVEGGGLRCWGLAKGLRANSAELSITVAYHGSYTKDTFTSNYEDITIATWDIDTIPELINNYDTIIVSYCMGGLSKAVVDSMRPDQQLILDCNVPIYVEASARETKDLDTEYQTFSNDVHQWSHVLRRGDVFLCASEAQKDYYKGVLSGVGRINPATYYDDMIKIVPYGVYRDEPQMHGTPITKLVGKKDCLKVLWFGGIYPWFDIRNLADAIQEVNKTIPARLIVVGGKNPFNNHPDFLQHYNQFLEYVSTDKMREYVYVQDWIDFKDRADWYLDADIVVAFNKLGEENRLSWRTRLVDYMWADLPILTNGGDPLGEIMLAHDAAIKMESLETDDIAKAIIAVAGSGKSRISELRKNLRGLKADFYWDKVTAEMTAAVTNHVRAIDLERYGTNTLLTSEAAQSANGRRITFQKVASRAKKVPAYAQKYGYRTTARVMTEMVGRKLKVKPLKVLQRKSPAYVFVSHQLDMSGAPFIAIDMALDFKKAGKDVAFYSYLPAHNANISKLSHGGIRPHLLMNKDMVPHFVPGDTVILNTVAHSETVKEALFDAAERGIIKQLIWYLHEDDPELIFRPDEKKRIVKMLKNDQLKMLVAAHKILENYIVFFGTSHNIVLQPYRHVVPAKYHRQLTEKDFSKKLTFVLPGTVGDGRKGQLPIFYAFVEFYKHYYSKNKGSYRDFELILVGMWDDFLSRQLIAHAGALDGHFSSYGRVSWHEDLDIVAKGNFTICYSIREALPLFVFEGMVSGHPVLRNDSSGMQEQLIPGKNGFLLDSNDFNQVVETLEKVLHKKKTSNATLAAMSAESHKIAKAQESNSYLESIEK